MGAIGEGGVRVLNHQVLRAAGVSPTDLAEVECRERAELDRRARLYRGDRPPVRLAGRTARWRVVPVGAMRVPGVVFGSKALVDAVEPEALRQVANVAGLPGIVEASCAMPDVHWGYGFPIGGVAATDVGRGGAVSPGGVGFDISCGVRLLVSPLSADELAPRIAQVMDALDAGIPRGLGGGGVWHLDSDRALEAVLRDGAEPEA
jgi:tRNA-splicing ligase RtcB (3'-phosphate/5'-hydroxy nucleic acid ligase)